MKIGILFRTLEDDHPLADSFNEVLDTVKMIEKIVDKIGHETTRIHIGDTYEELTETLVSYQGKIDLIVNLGEAVGEDTSYESKIPKLLADMGFRFTGSNHEACSLCESKVNMKELFLSNGLPSSRYEIYNDIPKKNTKLNFPVIVKPSREGGSLGISFENVVENDQDLKRMVSKLLAQFNQPIIAEEYIEGREIYVPILGNDSQARTLITSENIFNYPEGRYNIMTYDSKWTEGSMDFEKTRYVIDPELDDDLKREIEKISLEAYRLSKCNDYCRVDFRIKDNIPYLLELNYNPCINPHDLIFTGCLDKSGISYEEFIIQLIDWALSRDVLEQEISM